MNSKYADLFDTLVKSYYQGNFDETFRKIMDGHDASPQETLKIISSLCGVSIDFDNDYLYNLKKAITNYTVNKTLVEKLESCTLNCPKGSDENFMCQAVCPFNAIYYDESLKATAIDPKLCTNCGLCIDACKNGRIIDKIDFIPIANLLKDNKTVIAAVAPSIIGQFGRDVSLDQLRAALISIGFTDMIEVAFAADVLSIKEALEFNNKVESPDDLMITSCCCPIWVGMLKTVYNELIPNLSPSVSPMIAAGKIIKRLNPDAKVVFIGPCIAKKAEAKEKEFDGIIDFVLTFQELNDIFKALEVKPNETVGIPSKEYTSRGGRLYATSGGVSIAIGEVIEELFPKKYEIYNPKKADGIKECREVLDQAKKGTLKANFLEGMGCIGGCVGGPKTLIPLDLGAITANSFAYKSPIKVPIHSNKLDSILKELGVSTLDDFSKEDFLSLLERKF